MGRPSEHAFVNVVLVTSMIGLTCVIRT